MGGGIAGVSAAARLAPHGHTVAIEAESAFGYHSGGRSATFYHFGIGNSVVRGLTAFSRSDVEQSSDAGIELPVPSSSLFIATPEMIDSLVSLQQVIAEFSASVVRRDGNWLATTAWGLGNHESNITKTVRSNLSYPM